MRGFRQKRLAGIAGGGNRTHTLLREPDFESGASASSATPALLGQGYDYRPWQVYRKRRVVVLPVRSLVHISALWP